MKILHTSDLHIGKRINDYSMVEDQRWVLGQIVAIAREQQPDAIILAGDIYDKSVPSAEAVGLFDDFLVELALLGKSVFIISGNHDSAERIAFASRIMESSRVYLSPVYGGRIEPVVLREGDMEVAFYLLPFVKPSLVQHYAPEGVEVHTYDEALRFAIEQMGVDPGRRNVLVTHQFVTDALRSDSEDIAVGGLDNIDVSTFDAFDYVALGHLHRPQYCGRETVRYSGSPMKYSFSEVEDCKSVTMVEIRGGEAPEVTERALTPLHDWYDLRGTYAELADAAFYQGTDYQEGYVRITLTDEEDIPDGMRRLKAIYHRLMELRYDNKRTRAGMTLIDKPMNAEQLSPDQLFGELFEKQNAQALTERQRDYLDSLIRNIFNKH